MLDDEYKDMIKASGLVPSSYEKVAIGWERKETEWYHALIAIEDLPVVLDIPNLNIYAWTRCKLVVDDGSEGDFHWHALVHFYESTKDEWKKRAARCGVRFSSRKKRFQEIQVSRSCF